jgi:hypothetical protein
LGWQVDPPHEPPNTQTSPPPASGQLASDVQPLGGGTPPQTACSGATHSPSDGGHWPLDRQPPLDPLEPLEVLEVLVVPDELEVLVVPEELEAPLEELVVLDTPLDVLDVLDVAPEELVLDALDVLVPLLLMSPGPPTHAANPHVAMTIVVLVAIFMAFLLRKASHALNPKASFAMVRRHGAPSPCRAALDQPLRLQLLRHVEGERPRVRRSCRR